MDSLASSVFDVVLKWFLIISAVCDEGVFHPWGDVQFDLNVESKALLILSFRRSALVWHFPLLSEEREF